MLWDFLNMWEYKKIRFFTIFGLIVLGVGIVGVIIHQSGPPATSTRVYELPSRTRPHIQEQAAAPFKPVNENENIAAVNDYTDYTDDISSLGDSPEANDTGTEDSETAANSTDSDVQSEWVHYDPPPPDPEQERIWRMEERVQELQEEIHALSPQVEKDIKLLPRLNELVAEQLRIQQDLGRLHVSGTDPFVGLEIENFMVTTMTERGLPVSAGPRLADLVEKSGDIEAAEKIRAATRKAMESGDEFFQHEHVEKSEED